MIMTHYTAVIILDSPLQRHLQLSSTVDYSTVNCHYHSHHQSSDFSFLFCTALYCTTAIPLPALQISYLLPVLLCFLFGCDSSSNYHHYWSRPYPLHKALFSLLIYSCKYTFFSSPLSLLTKLASTRYHLESHSFFPIPFTLTHYYYSVSVCACTQLFEHCFVC